jgi:integration host factor subunit beta|tara:strand:+ start:267 stop:566 length:300 start_codon:yes stop_codon:yes gene_type:complete
MQKISMTKSELIESITDKQNQLTSGDVELSIKMILEKLAHTLFQNKRIEIRGFGSFCLHHRAPRTGRNPKTGEAVELPSRSVPYFKPGKELRERVNDSL